MYLVLVCLSSSPAWSTRNRTQDSFDVSKSVCWSEARDIDTLKELSTTGRAASMESQGRNYSNQTSVPKMITPEQPSEEGQERVVESQLKVVLKEATATTNIISPTVGEKDHGISINVGPALTADVLVYRVSWRQYY